MLAGSLYLLWPWRIPVALSLDDHDFTRYQHALPATYAQVTGQAFSPWICLGLAAAGMVLVLLLETVAGNNATETPENH